MDYSRRILRDALDRVELRFDLAREFMDRDVAGELDERTERLQADVPGDDRAGLGGGEDAYEQAALILRSGTLTYAFIAEIQVGAFEIIGRGFPYPYLPWSLEEAVQRLGSLGLMEAPYFLREPVFGVSVKIPREYDFFGVPQVWPDDPNLGSPSRLYFPRLLVELPLIIVPGDDELHGLPHPSHATAACYARRGDQFGVIAAGHSFALAYPGASVPLVTGMDGQLLVNEFQPIDAAFVEVPKPPGGWQALQVVNFPTGGDEVDVITQRGTERRHVVQVNNNIVAPQFGNYPIVFYMDDGLLSGDSGSLIRLSGGSREAIGIYTGAHRAADLARTSPLGIGQNFAQAVFALRVEPLEALDI